MSYIDGTNLIYEPTQDKEMSGFLPIRTVHAFINFANNADNFDKDVDGNDKGEELGNLKELMKAIIDKNESKLKSEIEHNAMYYYKLISSLVTSDVHGKLIDDYPLFELLEQKAMSTRQDAHKQHNEVLNSAENSTDNWTVNTEHLNQMYKRIRANRNHQYINLLDDNSTILRQGQLNRDMLLRRRYLNSFLKIIVIFLSVIILIGFMNHIGYSSNLVMILLLVTFVLLGITMISTAFMGSKMHVLEYTRLSFPGYPVVDEDIQNKYVGDCSTDDDSRSVQCSGVA